MHTCFVLPAPKAAAGGGGANHLHLSRRKSKERKKERKLERRRKVLKAKSFKNFHFQCHWSLIEKQLGNEEILFFINY